MAFSKENAYAVQLEDLQKKSVAISLINKVNSTENLLTTISQHPALFECINVKLQDQYLTLNVRKGIAAANNKLNVLLNLMYSIRIVNEFLMSIGILANAHDKQCPIYKKIMKEKPLWASRKKTASMQA